MMPKDLLANGPKDLLAGRRQPQSFAGGLMDSFAQGVSLGFGDELTALESAALGRTPQGGWFDYSQPFRERYDRNLAAERAQQARFRGENPVTAIASEIAGGIANPLSRVAGVKGAAAYGAAYGFGSGEGGLMERATDAAISGTFGGAFAAAVPAMTGMLGNWFKKSAAPTIEKVKSLAQNAYRKADQSGLVVKSGSFQKMVERVGATVADEGIDKTIHPKATAALNRLREEVGGTMTLKHLDTLRRVVRGAAQSTDADERRIAGIMLNEIDDYLTTLKPSDVAAGDAKAAASALRDARELWSRFRKAELINDAVERAARRAQSTGSGGNAENAIRQNIRSLIDNPKTRRAFNQQELKAMKQVVQGTPTQNTFRLIGKLSPQGSGLMAALGIGATAYNPWLAAAPAAGMIAKPISEGIGRSNVSALQRQVLSGGNIPLSAEQQAIVNYLNALQAPAGVAAAQNAGDALSQ